MDYVEMLIPPLSEGHVLLTSRIYATRKWAPSVLVPPMRVTAGAHFFLRRASLLSSDESPDQLPAALLQEAIEVVQALHGIPLALDQAGAYLKETGCRPAEYLALYRTDPGKMLKQRGRPIDNSHPASLLETLLQIFDRLSPDALEVLRLFTFSASNTALPSLLSGQGLNQRLRTLARNPFAYHAVLAELNRFSLLVRDRTNNRNLMYPIVQTVCASLLNAHQRRAYARMAASLEQEA